MSESEEEQLPSQLEPLRDAVMGVQGLLYWGMAVVPIKGVTCEQLVLPGLFAHMPHTALRRSGGARPGEGLLRVELGIERALCGLLALEFLAWFCRDCARAGLQVDLRPIASMPSAGGEVYLGQTLQFFLELFVDDGEDDHALFGAGAELGRSLALEYECYKPAFEQVLAAALKSQSER